MSMLLVLAMTWTMVHETSIPGLPQSTVEVMDDSMTISFEDNSAEAIIRITRQAFQGPVTMVRHYSAVISSCETEPSTVVLTVSHLHSSHRQRLEANRFFTNTEQDAIASMFCDAVDAADPDRRIRRQLNR